MDWKGAFYKTILLCSVILVFSGSEAWGQRLKIPFNYQGKIEPGNYLLVYDRDGHKWLGYSVEEIAYGDGTSRMLLKKISKSQIDFDVNQQPNIKAPNGSKIHVAVASWNDLLYEVARGKFSEDATEDQESLQQLAGLIGGNLIALVESFSFVNENLGSISVSERKNIMLAPEPDEGEGKNEVLKNGVEYLMEVFKQYEAALHLIQVKELGADESATGFSSEFSQNALVNTKTALGVLDEGKIMLEKVDACLSPTWEKAVSVFAGDTSKPGALSRLVDDFLLGCVDVSTVKDLSGSGEVKSLKAVKERVKEFKLGLDELNQSIMDKDHLVGMLSHADAGDSVAIKKRIQEKLGDIFKLEKSMKESFRSLRDSQRFPEGLGFWADRKRLTQAINQLTGSDQRKAILKAAAFLKDFASQIDPDRYSWTALTLSNGTPLPFEVAYVLPEGLLSSKSGKERAGELTLRRKAEFAESIRFKYPAETKLNYSVSPKKRWSLGLALTSTRLVESEWVLYDNPLYDPDNMEDGAPRAKVIGKKLEKERAGQVALMINWQLWQTFDWNPEIGLEFGSNTDTDDPGFFLGITYDLGKHARIGWGYTYQRVELLQDGQTEVSFLEDGSVDENSIVSSFDDEYEIRLRDKFRGAAYLSLTLRFDNLNFFGGGDSE